MNGKLYCTCPNPCFVCGGAVQGRSGLAGSQTARSFPRRSFAKPSWVDEDTVDSADVSVSFFSKVSSRSVRGVRYAAYGTPPR